ncbi:toll/interleukin-1 receptor domain-containing protein [Streptomyces sp. NPDC088725]|uniref:toll/interleukin-1 receptor domain-containing protein n=1 Tax=Streptomyces sp. NPDC088725 TaxID=3365873 RepID=UPI00381111C8
MHDIFVNYRTGDEEGTAALIERDLSARFGSDRVFRASKSIAPGHRFPQELITAVRRCRVLLVVIGPRWTEARSADGGLALEDPEDWTCREILEAFESGALVIPVLVGRKTRLATADLPPALGELADCQYRRLDHRNDEADLAGLAAVLLELLPDLGPVRSRQQADQEETDRAQEARGAGISIRDVRHRQRSGIGNLAGGISGTFIGESRGPVHTGDGNQYNGNGPQFSGDGMGVAFVAGDNSGTVRQESHGERGCVNEGR